MDFYRIKERSVKNGVIEVYPDYRVCRSKDLMVRSKSFYGIWDEEKGLWSTDEYDVQRLVDDELYRYAEEVKKRTQGVVTVKYLGDFSSSSWLQFRNYVAHLTDNSHQLDESLTFANTEVKKTDYISRRLPYPLSPGPIEAYTTLMDTLYDPEQKRKLEWSIGAIVSGDSKYIQKFIVLYGPQGAGKSTVLEIIQAMFPGYYTTFEAQALTGSSNTFSTEVFRANPLIAINHDGDLSRIEDNTKLNSIVSHEEMTMNEKFKPSYTARINAFLYMGTNKPVKITDAKSGIIRRLIDVRPSGRKLPFKKYQTLMSQIEFELGAIAHHCLETYRAMGRDYYANYKPIDMMMETDIFFNFIEDSFDVFAFQEGVSLAQAYAMYKEYCQNSSLEYRLPQHKFREELKNYFHTFSDRAMVDGSRVRNWYSGFKTELFVVKESEPVETGNSIIMDQEVSIFDEMCADQPAQYASSEETPSKFWSFKERLMYNPKTKQREMMIPPENLVCNQTLKELDTSKLHYVKPPLNHIVIDFDLKDSSGNKSLDLNLEAASLWPPTYAELSKGGSGIHLHYIYDGDPTELSRIFKEGIEIKVFSGDSSLRRRLTKCNNVPVATINSGLPLKEKKVISPEGIKSERALRDMIERNLRKEIHPGTKPSMDFIHKILEDAYASDLSYDVTNLRPRIMSFANNSSNQALYCLKLMQHMKFASKDMETAVSPEEPPRDMDRVAPSDERLVFFDCEVFPNLFVLNWKYEGSETVVRMINPAPHEVENLTKFKLVGFNCRQYDNHILYGRIMGYNNAELYKLSSRIISNSPNAKFAQAYNLSYADIYDYSSKKQSLKKWQVELGIHHLELGLPWDEPVDESLWEKVAEYCDNDVISTEVVHNHLAQDFVARKVLSELSGLPINAPTQSHTARIIFEGDKDHKRDFIYTDLSTEFPGYKYSFGKSEYCDEIVGEGGYVYAEPGMYENVAVLDVASMHPTSIKVLELFGERYTKNFVDLLDARLAIKSGNFDEAKKLLNGALAPYLDDEKDAKALSYALKIVVNIVYGLTSAHFDNPFKDPRNVDNIVAKRGALFMIDLKNMVQDLGYQVVHIKTDSIKIPNADQTIIDIITKYGKEYGYTFEHETTYERMCLVNDAVYIAKKASEYIEEGDPKDGWEAVGAQFKHPYVFKTLFSKQQIEFPDLCETKSVKTALYLDFNPEDTPMVLEKELRFIGKTGVFVPVTDGGGVLLRKTDDGYASATGAKGYRWVEAEMFEGLDMTNNVVDWTYFNKLADAAIEKIMSYGDFETFTR